MLEIHYFNRVDLAIERRRRVADVRRSIGSDFLLDPA